MAQASIHILEFSAPLCSACQEVAQTIQGVLAEPCYKQKVSFERINGLEQIPLLTEYGLADGAQLLEDTAFPITIFIKNDQEVLRRTDTFEKHELRDILQQLMGSPLDHIQIQGAIIIRLFHEGDEQDATFVKNKAKIQSIMGHDRLFRRIHFEWQSRKALFARSYALEQHPEGCVTLLFNQNGEEAARIEGELTDSLLEQTVVQVFQGKKLGIIANNTPQKDPAVIEKVAKEPLSHQYAQTPQRKLQLIEFYQNNCASCDALAPTLEQLTKKYKNWLEVFQINGEQESELKQKWLRHTKGQMIFYPIVLLTDEDGRVLYNSDDYKKLEAELDLQIRHFLYLEMA